MTTQEILEAARSAKSALALADNTARNAALLGMADALCSADDQAAILAANAEDMAAAKGHISDVMLDRLALTAPRIEAMAQGIREVAALPDPVGRVLNRVERPNGLVIEKTAVPMGVIAIIYESRPNVTSDAAALAIKSGNACILRCGKEAWRSANAIVTVLRQGLKKAGLPETAVCLIEDTTHASANALMTAVGYVDLLIPRGGAGLIRACVQNAKVPCIQTGTGICHVYVDDTADLDKALDIIENAKASRPSVCNAEEVCLVHSAIAGEFLPRLAQRLGLSRADAKMIIDGYNATFPTVHAYMQQTIEKARRQGYVTTVSGRRRMQPDINSHNATVRGYAERNAINAPIQGSAADVIKTAMVTIFAEMERLGLRSRMIMQVHDELNFNVVPGEEEVMKEIVPRLMAAAYHGSVRLDASCGTGPDWLTAH